MDNELYHFRKEYQLWKACGKKSDDRPALEYVLFDNGYAYASNAHILAKVSLKTLAYLDDDDYMKLNGYCIHADALRLLSHYDNIKIDDDGETVSIVCNIRENTLTFGLTPKKRITPPDYEAVLKAEGEHMPIEKIGIEKKSQSLLKAKRSQLKQLETKGFDDDLFSFKGQEIEEKKDRIRKEIEDLENGKFNYWFPPTYINRIKELCK